MEQAEKKYQEIADRLCAADPALSQGKMMSSPGLIYKGKNVAFFHHLHGEMVFKLGKDFDPEAFGLNAWSWLSPFKSKPPMKAWFQIPETESMHWEALAKEALLKMKKELG